MPVNPFLETTIRLKLPLKGYGLPGSGHIELERFDQQPRLVHTFWGRSHPNVVRASLERALQLNVGLPFGEEV